jgi:hypothetical protein
MRIVNETGHADAEVRNLVKFGCRGVDMTRIMVVIQGSGGATQCGRVFQDTPDCSPAALMETVDRLVVVNIAAEDRYPMHNMRPGWDWVDVQERDPADRGGRYLEADGQLYRWTYGAEMRPRHGWNSPRIDFRTWREGLIGVVAHQARHIYQYCHHKRSSDEDAERFAAARIDAYRAALATANANAKSATMETDTRHPVRFLDPTPFDRKTGGRLKRICDDLGGALPNTYFLRVDDRSLPIGDKGAQIIIALARRIPTA